MYRSVRGGIRDAINSAVDSVMMSTPFHANARNVLFVRLDAIGDFVLWLDAAQSLARHYRAQGQSPILIGDRAWSDWAGQLGVFDHVISFDRRAFLRNPLYRMRLVQEVRRLGSTIAIHPTYSRVFELGDALVRVCGASTRIGSSGDTSSETLKQRRTSDRWYTRLIDADRAPRMELVRNAEFVRGLLGNGFLGGVFDLRAYAAAQAAPACAGELEPGERFYVLFPGAHFGDKIWPVSRFAEIAARLHGETGWRGVVCGGPSESGVACELCETASAPLLNWAGRTSLAELCGVLGRARLLVTNDSSAVHLATSVGLRSVCIVGGGHYGRFLPYAVEREVESALPLVALHAMDCFGCNWRCIFPVPSGEAKPCVTGVTVDQVFGLVGRILREQGIGGEAVSLRRETAL